MLLKKYFALAAVALLMTASCCAHAENGPAVLRAEDQFTDSDLVQQADIAHATALTVTDGAELRIKSAGVYVLTGRASEASVVVEAGKKDEVRLVLDSLNVANQSLPCISVQKAGKVYITSASADNELQVTGQFAGSGNAAIYSKADLTLSGTGGLTIRSLQDGVSSKGNLRITGGEYLLHCGDSALKAKDSILISGGAVTVSKCMDGLHAENNKDDTLGFIYISGGSVDIACDDDAIHGQSFVQIDGGEIRLSGHEGIESTYIRLNGGSIQIDASDDGINAGRKSAAWDPAVEINGGSLSVRTTTAKCDAIDANGDILIRGGTVVIESGRPFDCDGSLIWEGGAVTVNGQAAAPDTIQSLIVR